jgi:hypothetical protein
MLKNGLVLVASLNSSSGTSNATSLRIERTLLLGLHDPCSVVGHGVALAATSDLRTPLLLTLSSQPFSAALLLTERELLS